METSSRLTKRSSQLKEHSLANNIRRLFFLKENMTGLYLVFVFVFAQSSLGANVDENFFQTVKEGHMKIKCEQKVCL